MAFSSLFLLAILGRQLRMASCAADRSSVILSNRSSIVGSVGFLEGWCACGTYPISNSNGDFFVVLDGHEFLVYCASSSHWLHCFWSWVQNSRRYCSKDWFVRSLCPSVCGW